MPLASHPGRLLKRELKAPFWEGEGRWFRHGYTYSGHPAACAVALENLRIIDQENPPSRPHEIKGRAAIAAYYDDVCGRIMTHRLDSGIREGDRLAFTQTCSSGSLPE